MASKLQTGDGVSIINWLPSLLGAVVPFAIIVGTIAWSEVTRSHFFDPESELHPDEEEILKIIAERMQTFYIMVRGEDTVASLLRERGLIELGGPNGLKGNLMNETIIVSEFEEHVLGTYKRGRPYSDEAYQRTHQALLSLLRKGMVETDKSPMPSPPVYEDLIERRENNWGLTPKGILYLSDKGWILAKTEEEKRELERIGRIVKGATGVD